MDVGWFLTFMNNLWFWFFLKKWKWFPVPIPVLEIRPGSVSVLPKTQVWNLQ
jgi:hypothetical protein